MAGETIELRQRDAGVSTENDRLAEAEGPNNAEFASLPPVDTGTQAWLFLAACWGVEAMTFGTIHHVGSESIFHVYFAYQTTRFWLLLWCLSRLL